MINNIDSTFIGLKQFSVEIEESLLVWNNTYTFINEPHIVHVEQVFGIMFQCICFTSPSSIKKIANTGNTTIEMITKIRAVYQIPFGSFFPTIEYTSFAQWFYILPATSLT